MSDTKCTPLLYESLFANILCSDSATWSFKEARGERVCMCNKRVRVKWIYIVPLISVGQASCDVSIHLDTGRIRLERADPPPHGVTWCTLTDFQHLDLSILCHSSLTAHRCLGWNLVMAFSSRFLIISALLVCFCSADGKIHENFKKLSSVKKWS